MRKCWEIAGCTSDKFLNCPAMQLGKSCWTMRKCFSCAVNKDGECPIRAEHRRELLATVKRAQSGDEIAVEELIKEFSRYVFQAEKKYFIPGASREDLHQEGLIGLYTAIKNYDENRNLAFEDFAGLSIRNSIIRAIRSATQKKQMVLTNAHYMDEDPIRYARSDYLRIPEKIVLGDFQAKEIYEIINLSLSDFERKVMKLKLSGFNIEEISQVVSEKKKTVENALYRSRQKIKSVLEAKEKASRWKPELAEAVCF